MQKYSRTFKICPESLLGAVYRTGTNFGIQFRTYARYVHPILRRVLSSNKIMRRVRGGPPNFICAADKHPHPGYQTYFIKYKIYADVIGFPMHVVSLLFRSERLRRALYAWRKRYFRGHCFGAPGVPSTEVFTYGIADVTNILHMRNCGTMPVFRLLRMLRSRARYSYDSLHIHNETFLFQLRALALIKIIQFFFRLSPSRSTHYQVLCWGYIRPTTSHRNPQPLLYDQPLLLAIVKGWTST